MQWISFWDAIKTRYDKYLFFRQTAYNKKDTVYTYLRHMMALPFLPSEHIPDTFNRLKEKATNQDNQAIQDVLNYVYRTWINNNVFSVEYWYVFMTSIRTNNDVEGWHYRLNYRMAARGPVPFYSLLTELYSEAADIPLQLKMVTEGKLQRYQRRHTRQIQGKLFTLWYQYCSNTIFASRLLKECAGIYGPPPK